MVMKFKDKDLKCTCGKCKTCCDRKWARENPERRAKINRKWIDSHPDVKIKQLDKLNSPEVQEQIHKRIVCNILKKHADDLKDDPERLSTAFLQDIIGIKCKEKKKSN